MDSGADDTLAESGRDLSQSTPAKRVALALALGARDLALFAASHTPPLELHVAAQLLDRQRQAGRRPSRCIDELIG